MTDLDGARVAAMTGTIEPDWGRLNERLSEEIEPGATIEGLPATFSIKTPLSGEGDSMIWKACWH